MSNPETARDERVLAGIQELADRAGSDVDRAAAKLSISDYGNTGGGGMYEALTLLEQAMQTHARLLSAVDMWRCRKGLHRMTMGISSGVSNGLMERLGERVGLCDVQAKERAYTERGES